MEMNDNLKNFIESNIDVIDHNRFDKLYVRANLNFLAPNLTELFLEVGIDPLKYLTEVPDNYMKHFKSLKQFPSLHSGIKEIGVGSFAFSSLVNVEIPSSIEYVHNGAFFNCKDLKTLIIHDGTLSVDSDTCSDCYNLSLVQLADSIQRLGEGCFSSCFNLKEIVIPHNLVTIEERCFEKSGLESIIVPGNIIEIESRAFFNCSNLTSVILEEGVEIIKRNAFEKCNQLKHIKLPTSLHDIDDICFPQKLSKDTIFYIPKNNKKLSDYMIKHKYTYQES